jgi:hypothetical protein
MTTRARQRDNAGASPASWKKHRLLWRAASGQAHAYRRTHPHARCLIIDMHAADGAGVPMPQLELFGPPPTYPTPLLATRLAATIGNTDVVLCEQKRQARRALAQQFPGALLLADHAELLSVLRPEHRWALVLNDPCGYADHGIEVLQRLTCRVRLDTLIAFNEAALRRLMGMEESPAKPDTPFVAKVRALRPKYAWMAHPINWARALAARQMAQSVLIKGSPNFHYRIFVLSHTLSQTLRPPTWERVL